MSDATELGSIGGVASRAGHPTDVGHSRNAGGRRPLISLRDLSYRYGTGARVLDRVSLDIFPGEVVSIIGPSGCGKSTLLRLVAGITYADSGTVRVAPEIVDERCSVTMVFQNDTLLPWRTVEQNAALYSRFQSGTRRRAESRERTERIAELLALVGLYEHRKSYPYQLSGGMRRRLAFIGAVAPSPRLLLLDEPFASVDEPTRIQIHHDILPIIRRLEMAVIIVTHDLGEAASLSDRVVILTGRPASISSEHHVAFGRDRDIVKLRESPEFMNVYGALWRDLRLQLRATQPGDQPGDDRTR